MLAPWLRLLFHPWCRLDRTRFWYAIAAAALIAVLPDIVFILARDLAKAKHERGDGVIVTLVAMSCIAVAAYIVISASARRFNDQGRSSWWIFIGFVPIVGALICLVLLGFLPGEAGRNRYGSAPGGEAADLGAIFDAEPVVIVEQKGRGSNLAAIIVAWLLGFGLFTVGALLNP